MAQQTAVSWLAQQILDNWNDISANARNIEEFIEQAQQIEEEQIKNSHNHGFTEGTCFGASPIGYKFITSEQYYTQTYKNE